MLKVDFKEAGWIDGSPSNKNVDILSGAEVWVYLPAVQIKPLLCVLASKTGEDGDWNMPKLK